jgi:F-type H+-transporting ATPase subunit b
MHHYHLFANLLGKANGPWLSGDLQKVAWMAAAFVVMAIILLKFGKQPFMDMLANRQERIRTELDTVAQQRLSAEAERDRIKAALADSDAEAARILSEARAAAERLDVDTAARTEHELVQLRERATADLASTRRQAEADLSAELSRLSLGAAERVVRNSLDDATQQRLIDDYISQVGAQN